jgi:hypothetical protein
MGEILDELFASAEELLFVEPWPGGFVVGIDGWIDQQAET